MVCIYFNDGSSKNFDSPVSGGDIAESISVSLGKSAVLLKKDGLILDLSTVIKEDSKIEILTLQSQGVLEVLRHSAAHVLAKAGKELFPNIKIAIGPVTEEGFFYDFKTEEPFSQYDAERLEKKMAEIISRDIPFERVIMSRKQAIELFEDLKEDFKLEILREIQEEKVAIYKLDDLYDLCRGPHLPSTSFIGNAFKITKIAGSYWKGDKNQIPLQRVFGIAWPTKKEMEYYFLCLEEAEKRDHRKLGTELNLFHMQDFSPGAIFWHPKGWVLYRTLQNFIRKKIEEDGYEEVNTPCIVDKMLWEKSGHWDKFKETMFVTELEDKRTMAIKPMNCPCHVQIFNNQTVSYKNLPWRIAEFGSCHRYEPSGALHGLMRVRGFVQDDAHIFCTKQQIVSETKKFCDLLRDIYSSLGFDRFCVKFSDRPNKRAGSDEIWDLAERSLREASIEAGLDYTLNSGEGAFYGPKLEFILKDCLGRDWQCGTFQVDFVLPERLGAYYITEEGIKEHPVMLHRAVLGSFERFIGILIEHYAGNFPTWLAPVQVVITTITESANSTAYTLLNMLKERGIRAELDIRNEKISYKVREHSVQKIPYIFILGKKEASEGNVTVRKFHSAEQGIMSFKEAVDLLVSENKFPNL